MLDNLPEVDEELALPLSVLPGALVDPLPFLKAGLWEKVHIASLVPREKKRIADENPATGGMMGGPMGGMMGQGGGSAMMARRMMMMGGAGRMAGGARAGNTGMDPGMMSRMMMMKGMGGGGMMGRGGGDRGTGAETGVDYWKSEENKVMIRAFDFTVEPDNTYRYRVRIVVFNPNHNREDVGPKVDTKAEELKGPWSDPSDDVHMPSDVTPYLTGLQPASPRSDVGGHFQVIRFHPADGVTVPHGFGTSPGEIIGETNSAEIPVSDGSGKRSMTVDFNSRQIVLDVSQQVRMETSPCLRDSSVPRSIGRPLPCCCGLMAPWLLTVRPTIVANDVRRDIYNNYRHEISQSTKKRTSSMGLGMMGGMQARMMGGGRR